MLRLLVAWKSDPAILTCSSSTAVFEVLGTAALLSSLYISLFTR